MGEDVEIALSRVWSSAGTGALVAAAWGSGHLVLPFLTALVALAVEALTRTKRDRSRVSVEVQLKRLAERVESLNCQSCARGDDGSKKNGGH